MNTNDFQKVSLVLNGKMHLTYGHSNSTLCGLDWRYHNSHSETYCHKCQCVLAKAMKSNTEGQDCRASRHTLDPLVGASGSGGGNAR